MKKITDITKALELPKRVLQFGQGNFLRAFFDYMIDVYNEECDGDFGIIVCKNTPSGNLNDYHEQSNLYTVVIRGIKDKELYTENRIIRSIQDTISVYDDYLSYIEYAKKEDIRLIVSNTTEAGISTSKKDRYDDKPPLSFPSKLTKFLYERYSYFSGDSSKGVIVLPLELINDNGKILKSCIIETSNRWQLPEDFITWLDTSCIFCSTLVDRIVTGFPSDAEDIYHSLGYIDKLLVTCEPYSLLVIESESDISSELPLNLTSLPVVFTKDASIYRKTKLHLLNGTHTASVTIAFLLGLSTVYEMVNDNTLRQFMFQFMFHEAIPTIDLDRNTLEEFANFVIERFSNPFIAHSLEAISTFSISKYIARLLPCLKQYYLMFDNLPTLMVFSLAVILIFYKSTSELELKGMTDSGTIYYPKESELITSLILDASNNTDYINIILSNPLIWGEDLTQIKGLLEQVSIYVKAIETTGLKDTIENLLDSYNEA